MDRRSRMKNRPRARRTRGLRSLPSRVRLRRHGATASLVPILVAFATLARAAAPLEHSALSPGGIQAEHIVRLWHLTLIVCDLHS
jgi:hypothetical protein